MNPARQALKQPRSTHYLHPLVVLFLTLRQIRSDQTYLNLAEEGYVHNWQASGMQPIRNYWAPPEKLGYSEENSQKALAFRERIPKKIIALNQQGCHSPNLTRRAHTEAAAEARTPPRQAMLRITVANFCQELFPALLGQALLVKYFALFQGLSTIQSVPAQKNNRDSLSDSVEKLGRQLLRSQNRILKTAGVATSILGRSMAVTNASAEKEYHDLIISQDDKLTSSLKPSTSSVPTEHSAIKSASISPSVTLASRNELAAPIPFPPQERLLKAAFTEH